MSTARIWTFGDAVDTDQIIASQYIILPDIDEMKGNTFESIAPEFASKVQPGDILVAGNNFGCGSSREQAPATLKALGVQAVVAKSFARIFFRNAVNNGLLLLENADLRDNVQEGDTVDVQVGRQVTAGGKRYPLAPMAANVLAILRDVGLVPSLNKRNGIV